MGALTETLGKRLTAQEVAEYLGVDAETVRRYYHSLGGIRLGRLILFFENLMIDKIKEKSNAIQTKEKEQEDALYYLDYGSVQIATTRPETIFAFI